MAQERTPEYAHPLMLLFDRPQVEVERALVGAFQKLLLNGNDHSVLQKAKLEHRFVEPPTANSVESNIFCEVPLEAITCGLEIYIRFEIRSEHFHEPIRRACLGEAAAFGNHLGAVSIYWKPAKTISGFSFFVKNLTVFKQDGVFPIFSTVKFETGSVGIIRTSGLAWFCAQELELHYDMLAAAEAMHRCAWLAHGMIINGPYFRMETVAGIARGESFEISPTDDLNWVRVTRIAPRVKQHR